MGQKTNPVIFRLGITKTWNTEFFEKKKVELPLYISKDLEIKDYIQRFLETQGIILHSYKQYYSDSTLNLCISYFVSPAFILARKKSNKIVLVNKAGKKKQLKFETQNVLSNFLKVLSLFTKNKFDITAKFCCINKDLNFIKNTQKKSFLLLQVFKNTSFLREGIELLFHVLYNKNSAVLLATFISLQIKKVKRHKFFILFLKQTLTILFNSSFSKVRGIKVMIKGRLSGMPRAKHKIITIGEIPIQSISANVDYSQQTVHNSNGSYGIKVWIIEKE